MQTKYRSKKKVSGGRYHSHRSKRKYELTGYPAMTKLEEPKLKTVRTLGNNHKNKLLGSNLVNLADKDGKIKKIKIKTVLDNPANKHLARRNIITKGAVIETELGQAKVTSRPGQDGNINAVLVK
ncbi:30S ribosomal protein S8e [Nanoarchaeota archaeon]